MVRNEGHLDIGVSVGWRAGNGGHQKGNNRALRCVGPWVSVFGDFMALIA